MPIFRQLPFDLGDFTFRPLQVLTNIHCQTLTFKAVFEHTFKHSAVAAFLLSSHSFLNSSFAANFLANFHIDGATVCLFDAVGLDPANCFSLQFAPSLCVGESSFDTDVDSRKIVRFLQKLANTKYLRLHLADLQLSCPSNSTLDVFFPSHSQDANYNSEMLMWNQMKSLNTSLGDLIDQARISSIGIKAPNLSSLIVDSCYELTDDCLETISHNFANLTELSIGECSQVTDAGLEFIAAASFADSLLKFSCSDCNRISDVGIRHLATRCTALTAIDLGNTPITDEALEVLAANCTRLVKITVVNCDSITKEGVEKLKEKRPQCKVRRNYLH